MGQTRVAIYCRVSTELQDCERQVRDLRALAERRGFEVVSVFRETASGAKNNRPERKKVIELARKRGIDGILVAELSRWGRSMVDLVATLDELAGRGVSMFTASGEEFNMSTAMGRMTFGILATLAEFERNLLRERILSGLAAARARGKKLGRQPGQTIIPRAKRERILAGLAEGKSYRTLAAQESVSKNTVLAIAQAQKGESK